MSRSLFVLALVALSPLGLAACAHKTADKPTHTGADHEPPPSSGAASSSEHACSTDLDCGPRQLCIRNRCVDITADLAECSNMRVHFPLNSSEIDAGERSKLDRSARCLKADAAMHITIEGNADERGTEEYNLALGDKRATAVAKYLESLGASQGQLKTVSFGKENPLCTESDEGCWAKNRRAELKPSETAAQKGKPAKKK
jgi:peptidoglycan-associated lipoprotein